MHGDGAIGLVVSRRGDRLRIEVSDDGHPPAIRIVPLGEQRVGGRGLFIVDQMATAWGVPAGTAHVWAELALG
jgi:anti-sigma regulatory factor (Ser/Thr protein kinase)